MIQHFNYLEKLLVILSFLPILQTTLMHTFLKQIHIIHFVLDYMTLLNLTPLFTLSWFADAFITLFGYPCYILTQCGIYFSTFLFIQAFLTLLIKVYKTISINYNLEQNITIFSSIAHVFFNILTSELINDLKDAPSKKGH